MVIYHLGTLTVPDLRGQCPIQTACITPLQVLSDIVASLCDSWKTNKTYVDLKAHILDYLSGIVITAEVWSYS